MEFFSLIVWQRTITNPSRTRSTKSSESFGRASPRGRAQRIEREVSEAEEARAACALLYKRSEQRAKRRTADSLLPRPETLNLEPWETYDCIHPKPDTVTPTHVYTHSQLPTPILSPPPPCGKPGRASTTGQTLPFFPVSGHESVRTSPKRFSLPTP